MYSKRIYQVIKSFLSLVIIISILVFITKTTPQKNITNINSSENIFSQAINKLNYQKQVDEYLQQELKSDKYTFENPLVILDPYNESPLTALILFSTKQPSKISIAIEGDSDDTTILHTFSEISTNHIIPIYGLYPESKNIVCITQLSENDTVIAQNSVEIQTEQLPTNITNTIILTETYQEGYENGLNFNICVNKYAFDKNGTIRWFLSDTSLPSSYYMSNSNRFIITAATYHESSGIFYEIDKLGKIYNIYYTPFGSHHALITLPNKNLLALGSHGETVEDFIFEIDASSGEIINTMDLKQILQRTRFQMGNSDWLHSNSIVYDESDGTIILSSNFQSTIAKISWPDGEIKWLLSSPNDYMPRFEKYLLTPIGEDFEYSYNQHSINILPDYDNNPDTIDISLFDNGVDRPNSKYSRLVHYRINEKNMTVEQIWQYGKERGSELYSLNMSSFQMLLNNNRLGLFMRSINYNIGAPIIIEVNENSELIWDAEIISKSATGSEWSYQVYRLPVYFESDSELNINKTANNLIPKEFLNTTV